MVKNIRIWLGGSFDPVHLGHLAMMQHIANVLKQVSTPTLAQNITISLLPTARNPLKPNPTQNSHRLAMLRLGLDYLAQTLDHTIFQHSMCFQIDTTEIHQTDTVFTFNTLHHFREKYPDDSLIFVLGMDSILSFDKWYRAYELPSLCHLWVMPRFEEKTENLANLSEKLLPFLTNDLQDLINMPNGRIYLDKFEVMTVSSSQIRAILADKMSSLEDKKLCLQHSLNPSVLDYILDNQLYDSKI